MSYWDGMKETLRLSFRIAAINLFDPEIKRAPDEQMKSLKIIDAMIEQVRTGTPPSKVTPPLQITAAESRALLRGTGIHSCLSDQWEEYCRKAGKTHATAADSQSSSKQNPYLPQGWTQHLR